MKNYVKFTNLKKMSFFVVRKLAKKLVKLEVLLTSIICCVILNIVGLLDIITTKEGDGYYVTR